MTEGALSLNCDENINEAHSRIIRRGLPQNLNAGRCLSGVVLIDEVTSIIAQAIDAVVLKRIGGYRCYANLPTVRKPSREQELFHANLRSQVAS